MKVKKQKYKDEIKWGFDSAGFITDLGIKLKECGPGWCESELAATDKHHQHNSFIHAAVLSAMADHTAGAAAGTLMAADENVLTVEYKINFLRPAIGDKLFCRSEVLKPGTSFTIVESSVYIADDNKKQLVAKGIFTIAVVKKIIFYFLQGCYK
jgi:uncharacterized protein (TIGR00369 family)